MVLLLMQKVVVANIALKKARNEKLGELQDLQEAFKKIISEYSSMLSSIPEQSEHIYQEFKDFNLDVRSFNPGC